MDFGSREEEIFQEMKASMAESLAIFDKFRHLFKEKEEPSESETARQAQEIYRAMETEEWAWSDEYDEEEYPLPELRPHSPVDYRSLSHTILMPPVLTPPPSPPRARPPPPPPPPASCYRKTKSLSLDEQVLEKKTEINDKHGHKNNNNRVVSKRKMKRARNMEKRRRS